MQMSRYYGQVDSDTKLLNNTTITSPYPQSYSNQLQNQNAYQMRSLSGSMVNSNMNNVAVASILPSPMTIPQKPSVGAQESFVGEINFEARGGKALQLKGYSFGKDKGKKAATKTTESKRTYRYEEEGDGASEEEKVDLKQTSFQAQYEIESNIILKKESFEHLRVECLNSDPPSFEDDSIEPTQQDYLDAIPRANGRTDLNLRDSQMIDKRGREANRKLNFDPQFAD